MEQKIKININAKETMNDIFIPLMNDSNRYNVFKGSAGSGKSRFVAQRYILRLMGQTGRNLICLRKVDRSNEDSTFAELKGVIEEWGLQQFWTITTKPLKMVNKVNGNKIIFRGMNDDRQRDAVRSVNFGKEKLTDIWLEEATDFKKEDFEQLDDRLRGMLKKGLFYQMTLSFNPVNSNHWIKKDFFDYIDENTTTHHSTYLDNKFLTEDYHKRMMRRKELDPEGYKIFGLGQWGETGGLVFKNFEMKEFDVTSFNTISIGQDFGFNHANCILTVAMKDDDIYVLNELYVHEKETNEIIDLAQGSFDKTKFMYCDAAEPDRIKMWTKAGYRAKAVKKTKGANGKGYVVSQIDWLKGRKIYIHPDCINLFKEMQQWKWKKDNKTNEWLDEPVDFYDDAIAALRYATDVWRVEKGTWGW